MSTRALLFFFHLCKQNSTLKEITLLGNGERFSCMVSQDHTIHKFLHKFLHYFILPISKIILLWFFLPCFQLLTFTKSSINEDIPLESVAPIPLEYICQEMAGGPNSSLDGNVINHANIWEPLCPQNWMGVSRYERVHYISYSHRLGAHKTD